MKVKLFIFESVIDALAFERREETTPSQRELKVESTPADDPEADVPADAEPERGPVRRYRKAVKVRRTKAGKSGRKSYEPDEVITLAQKVAAGKITSKDAAKELGVTVQAWYQAKATYAKHIKKGTHRVQEEPEAPASPATIALTEDELHAAIQGLKEDGLDSIRIAQKLKISLKKVNENW